MANNLYKKLEGSEDKRKFISKSLQNILVISEAFTERPKTEEELCERLNWFFRTCTETQQLPTVEKMCLALCMPRQTVNDWELGRTRGLGPHTSDIIKKAKQILAALDAELAQEGKIQPVVYMFRAKNYYGLKDQQEVITTTQIPLGAAPDQKALEQKLKDVEVIDITPEPDK